jgi:hypothetical protein
MRTIIVKKIRPNPEENLIKASSISCLPISLTESPDSIFVSGNTVLAAKSV